MNCSALVERELRLAIRRPGGGYGIRLLCAWAATAAAFGLLFVWSAWRPGAGFGRQFLQVLAAGGYMAVLLFGMVLTADAISRERREGTLDLLLLTDLRIGDVVLGKLLAKMLQPLYGVLAIVPMLEISVLVGGTTAGECARLTLMLANGLFFALAASLLVSSTCQEQRSAYAGTILTILAMSVGIPTLGLVLWNTTANGLWYRCLLLLTPTGPYYFAELYSSGPSWFWAALVSNQLLAWGFIAWTRTSLVRSQSERSIRLARQESQEPPTSLSPAEIGRRAKRGRAPGSPSHSVAGSAEFRNGLGIMALCDRDGWHGALCRGQPSGTVTAEIALVLLGLAHLIVKLAIATDAVHAFGVDKRSGALESLLGTRLQVDEITAGILLNFRRRLVGPITLLFLATASAAAHLLLSGSIVNGALLLGAALVLPLDGYCLAWVGMFQGLVARNAAVALCAALFQVVLLPCAWFLMVKAFFWRSSTVELLTVWAAVALINQCVILSRARAQLREHFRTLALKPYGEKNPRMESEWSPMNWDEEEAAQLAPP